jgi:hypothetical protein
VRIEAFEIQGQLLGAFQVEKLFSGEGAGEERKFQPELLYHSKRFAGPVQIGHCHRRILKTIVPN